MGKIFCAIPGTRGSAFSVEVDEDKTVDDLKKVIKKENPSTITCDAKDLQLFLAKKDEGRGPWLTEEEVKKDVIDTTGLKLLGAARARLRRVGLSDEDVGGVDEEEEAEGRGPVNVLVVVPQDERSGTGVPAALPEGPVVNLSACEGLLAFLEGEMTNKHAIVSRPHILDDDSLQFQLVGREEAIKTAAGCFSNIIARSSTTATDRTGQVMPVCSGISGLGKTRMLEESGAILERLKLDPKKVFRVIIPYFNGFSPHPVEESMPIEASFSWRLLFRFFLDNNCEHRFAEWFTGRLPRNGNNLKLYEAINVIEYKLRKTMQGQEVLYLFIGIDEYQKIEKVKASLGDPNKSLLRELVEKIGALLCSKPSTLILLPMFAGTDLSVIAEGAIANSSYYVTERLPMTLLTMDQVFSIVETNASYARLLTHSQFCKNLFFLGGVPRWVVEYLKAVKKKCRNEEPARLDDINACFTSLWGIYVNTYLSSVEAATLVRLAAFAVSGLSVNPYGMFDRNVKWSRLRDSSLCLLVPRDGGKWGVHVPYSLLHSIGQQEHQFTTETEEAFIKALQDLNSLVDSTMFDLQPWQSWEMFGACFYAVRINALLMLGYSTITLGNLLPGTLMTNDTRNITVKLVPTKVFRCAEQLDVSTPEVISQKHNKQEKINWTSSGYIIVNGDGGAGVDIFFALKDANTDKEVVFVDQRKHQFGIFQPCHAKAYFSKLSVCPKFLVNRGARVVRGIMNCVAASNLATYAVPQDCYLLSRDETKLFHGTLAYHPACSPVISINSACKTALKTILKGQDVDLAIEAILTKRPFNDSENLRSFLSVKRLRVEFDESFDQLAAFSS